MQTRILKRHSVLITGATLALLCPVLGAAQSKTLASTIDVYVFPTEGQSTSQQSQDEAECYEWAMTNSGSDPFELGKQATADQQRATEFANFRRDAGVVEIQGMEGGRAFSFVIDETTGIVTAAIARDGASVSLFGACTDAYIQPWG